MYRFEWDRTVFFHISWLSRYFDKNVNFVPFFEVVENFYETSLEYVNKWKCSLGNTEKLKWVLLRKTPEWIEIQDSLNAERITRTETEETRVSISGPT
jgi:hypothetical protein